MVELTGQWAALFADDLHGVPFLRRGLIFYPHVYSTQIFSNTVHNPQICCGISLSIPRCEIMDDRAIEQQRQARFTEAVHRRSSGRWSLHKFRRTFASWHHDSGISARTLQAFLSHSSLETTLRYLRVAELRSERIRSQVDKTFAGAMMIGQSNEVSSTIK